MGDPRDDVPEAAHALARRWVDMINADIVAAEGSHLAWHALSIALVSIIASWVRGQPKAEQVKSMFCHVAALAVDGIAVGVELWNEEHEDYVEPPRRPVREEMRMPLHRAPRRRPPRTRPC